MHTRQQENVPKKMLKLILAGVLAIPCLLVCVVTAPILAILSIPPLLLLTFQKEGDDKFETNRKKNNSNSSDKNIPDHAIIFGGSTGIGFCVAQECIRKNVPRITILARNQDKLDKAKEELEQQIKAASTPTTTVVRVVSVNVSDFPALQKVAKDICPNPHTEKVVLYNCAGISYTLDMEKVQIETYMKLIQTNQLGAMYVLRAFIPVIYHGTIVLTSSAAGQVGLYGYTAYSPTKYALRGLAETVHQELVRTRPDVNIQVAFPTDTATPGYEEESKIMPELTKIINEAGGLSDPKEYV